MTRSNYWYVVWWENGIQKQSKYYTNKAECEAFLQQKLAEGIQAEMYGPDM